MRVALLDSNHVALSIARSLSKRGVDVDLLHVDGPSITDWSRSIHAIHRFPNAVNNVNRYCDALIQHLRQHRYDLVVPVSDSAVEICRHIRCEVRDLVGIAMSDEETLSVVTDKMATVQLAKSLGVPVPHSRFINSVQKAGSVCGDGISYPCYMKPSRSVVIVNNQIVRFKVSQARSENDLQEVCYLNANRNPVIVQEPIAGIGVGVHLIADHGEILAMVCQYRLHEMSDGPGSYRMSEMVREPLARFSTDLVREVAYHGVAMIEFKGDPITQQWHLMEINSRFWGSLPLTISSGLDMPYWLVRLFCEHDAATPTSVAVREMRQRQLKRDVGWLLVHLARRSDRLATLRAYFLDFKHLFRGKERIDYWDLKDPLPFLVDWTSLIGRVRRMIHPRLERLRYGAGYLMRCRGLMASARHKLRAGQPKILFLCHGNICRSPFAEAYLKQRYGYEHVKSAGVYPVDGRLPPPDVLKVAQKSFDIELSVHRSSRLDDDLLKWADLLLVMDYHNLADLREHKVETPVVLLGSFAGVGAIRDPYRKSQTVIRSSLERVATSIDRMMDAREQKRAPSSIVAHPV